MKTLRSTLLLLCSLLFTCGLSAQTVSGKLVDENQQALPYANVVLLSLPDSAFVAGAVSGDDGTFVLETTSGNQLVKISSIGYKTVYRPVPPTHIGTVQLVSDAQVLGEVVVKADLPKMQLKGDAMVTTVQGSILEKAGTGEDLLNKIPVEDTACSGTYDRNAAVERSGRGAGLPIDCRSSAGSVTA